MIIAILILLFIGWLVYELWLNPMIPYYENEKKYNEKFLKDFPKGTYITLEWKYFCEFRDEAIKEYEEKQGEKLVLNNGCCTSTFDYQYLLRVTDILDKAHEKLEKDGYKPLINKLFMLPSGVGTYSNWVEAKGDDEAFTWLLREKWENVSSWSINCKLRKLGVPIEDVRNPYKIEEMKPQSLIDWENSRPNNYWG